MTKPQRQRPGTTSTLSPNVEAINIGGVEDPSPSPKMAPSKPAPAKRAVTVRLDTVLIGQAQAAVLATQGRLGGYSSFNALVESAVAAEVEKAVQEFNSGNSFTPIDGQFRRGRPLQSN